MYRESERMIVISGTGETKHAAFQQALNQMKRKIAQENQDILLQIEPRDVQVLSAEKSSYRERFLGLLFPRMRTRYEIKLRVTVKLRYVDLSQLTFVEKSEERSMVQRFLGLRS